MSAAPAIRIADDEHVAIFGRTGSGKTYRARSFLQHVPRWVIVDPKWGITWQDVPLVTKFDPRRPRQILRAPMAYIGTPAEHDHYQREIMRAFLAPGPRVIYADEVANISKSTQRMGAGYDRVLRLGRQPRITGWSGTQRPAMIPAVVYTESSHFFVFSLTYKRDREKVAAFTDDRVIDLLARLGRHECVYWSVYRDAPTIIPANAIDISGVRTHTNTSNVRRPWWTSLLGRSGK
jgi:hypothetical protein